MTNTMGPFNVIIALICIVIYLKLMKYNTQRPFAKGIVDITKEKVIFLKSFMMRTQLNVKTIFQKSFVFSEGKHY